MSNFDNEIKQKGENFSLPPRPEVWKRVEAELDKQNRGRIIGWWWLTPVVIIAWGFAFSFLERKDQKAFYNQDATYHPNSEKTPAPPKKVMPQKRAEASENDAIPPSETIPASTVVIHKNKSSTTAGTTEHTGNKSKHVVGKNVSISSSRQAVGHQGKAPNKMSDEPTVKYTENPTQGPVKGDVLGATPNEKQPVVSGKLSHSSNEDIESHTSQTLTAPGENSTSGKLIAPVVATSDQPAEQKAASHSNVHQSVAIGKPADASKKIKNSGWRISIAGGMAINDSSIFKKHQKDSTDQSGGSSGGGGLIPEMENHQPGFTISASLARVFNLSRRWQWKPGIIFQYQEIRQVTGDFQPYQVDPSPPDWDYSAYFYFDPGKTLEHKGNNFRVALSSDFSFSLFKNKPALYVNAGVYGGYNIYNHFLLPDELQVWWIPSTQFYNDLFGGVSTGIEYRFKKGAGIGITGRHDFTQSYKPLRDKKYYWQSVMVEFSMPLNKTK